MTFDESAVKPTRGDAFEATAAEAAHSLLGPDADIFATMLSFNLFRAVNQLQRDLETNAYRPNGVSAAAFSIMFMIKTVGPTSPSKLATLLSTSTASTSSALNTLEKYGYVTRRSDAEDSRRVIVELTEAGDTKLVEVFAAATERESRWSSRLTGTENVMFMELLRALLQRRPSEH